MYQQSAAEPNPKYSHNVQDSSSAASSSLPVTISEGE